MILLALIATIGAHGPKLTTMQGTDAALECPFVSGPVCETAAGPDVTVTTTRASTRMCWTGSAWQTVPANTACIGQYGLASFGPGTNYWANSTTPSLWPQQSNVTVDGNVITDISASQSGQIRPANMTVTVGANLTVSCVLQAGTTDKARLWAGGPESTCPVTLTSKPARYSCPGTANSTTVAPSLLVGHAPSDTGSIIAHQCQFEVSSTPGPRHDCEAAPCSWAADVHTVSTAGWPVEAGRVDLEFTPLWSGVPSETIRLVSALYESIGWMVYIRTNGSIAFHNGTTFVSTGALSWTSGRRITVEWDASRVRFYSGGSLLAETGPLVITGPLPATAAIGSNGAGASVANGHIRLLRVSQ